MDTEKYSFAMRHSLTSLAGLSRVIWRHPTFCAQLLAQRLRYFRTRQFQGSLLTPEGCLIDTPDMLISYWCIILEQELLNRRWAEPFRRAERPLVVDVGANGGIFSLFAYGLNPSSEIIAFEPLPGMQARLERLKKRTGMNLTCYPLAAAETPGEVLFESPHGYDGISRVCTSTNPTGTTFRVKTTTLDNELASRDVFLMKIDVEGFECQVLAGAKRTLERTRFMVIEAQTPEHLANVTRSVGPGWQRASLGSSDFLFYRA
jgi:FkbM family methyltransferase